jgi:hypothetical protein
MTCSSPVSAVEDGDLCRYARELRPDLTRFESHRNGRAVLERVRRHVRSGDASAEVVGMPTLFVDGVLHRGGYDVVSLLEALGT